MARANSSSCKSWFHRVTTFLSKIEHEQICRNHDLSIQAVLHSVDSQLHDLYEQKWQAKLNTNIAVRGPKLVTINLEHTENLNSRSIIQQ